MYIQKTKRRFIKIVTVNFILLIFLLICLEAVLRLFFPFHLATIGHLYAPYAELYGWGYAPGEIIHLRDPDTGSAINTRANNHGWRGPDRQFSNENKNLRILFLGDSVSFGAIVDDENIYTQILQSRLSDAGYRVEIINISYGGWGTDQQFEALKNEGLKYQPHLVIVQFSNNDPGDNLYFNSEDEVYRAWKPFYYDLNENGNLHRNTNIFFNESNPKNTIIFGESSRKNTKTKIKYMLGHFQIFQHLHAIYINYKMPNHLILSDLEKYEPEYEVTQNKIEQIRLIFNVAENNSLIEYLKINLEKELDLTRLMKIIDESILNSEKDRILRILEKKWTNKPWNSETFYAKKFEQDKDSIIWRVYFALILEMKKIANVSGAEFAIFSSHGAGLFEWELYWCRIDDDLKTKQRYLKSNAIIHEFCNENHIDFIEASKVIQSARNDPHPNVEGNHTMADSIYDYLMDHHLDMIEEYKTVRR